VGFDADARRAIDQATGLVDTLVVDDNGTGHDEPSGLLTAGGETALDGENVEAFAPRSVFVISHNTREEVKSGVCHVWGGTARSTIR
jgi:hypothetical protein